MRRFQMSEFPSHFPKLVTPRLVLRQYEERDLAGIFEFYSDPVAMQYWSIPPVTDLSEVRPIYERNHGGFAAGTSISWVITMPPDDAFIGECSLFHIDLVHRRAEVGYGLHRTHWRRGIMREALAAAFAFAFDTMLMNRLEADVDPRNEASIGILTSLLFRREGYLRERWFTGGVVADTVLLGRIRSDKP